MPMRRQAVAVAAVLLLAACTGDPEAAETAVLGAATERGDFSTAAPAGAADPTGGTEPTGALTPEPDRTTPRSSPSLPPAATATAEPTGEATGEQASGNPADPADGSPPPGSTPTGEADVLASGEGWSTNALLPDDGGEGWTEIGGAPPIDRESGSGERLLVRLRHVETAGDSAGRRAACEGWLEASPERALRARGEAVVALLVDGESIAEQRRSLDLTLAAGEQHALPAWRQLHPVHAAEGATVGCSVTFTAAG